MKPESKSVYFSQPIVIGSNFFCKKPKKRYNRSKIMIDLFRGIAYNGAVGRFTYF